MGREVVVAVTNGRLDFGTWERTWGGSWMADTRVLTAGAGSGCWLRLSGSSIQSYLERTRLWRRQLMSIKHAQHPTPIAMTDIDASTQLPHSEQESPQIACSAHRGATCEPGSAVSSRHWR